MSKTWILEITLGPVSHFIGGGRRSRDLWWGSTWVSECTRAVAIVLRDVAKAEPPKIERLVKVELLIPEEERLQQIDKLRGAGGTGRLPDNFQAYGGRISNRVLARVEADDEAAVKQLVFQCDHEAHQHLATLISAPKDRLSKHLIDPLLNEKAWSAQLAAIQGKGDFIELFAAWAPVQESRGEDCALKRVRSLLIPARKSARLFESPSWARDGLRKSSLDPSRDSVLNSSDGERGRKIYQVRRRLGIGPDEHLDAIGFARRISIFIDGPNLTRLPFPPLSRVATDPWLARVEEDRRTQGDLKAIRGILEAARKDEMFFSWCSPARDPNQLPDQHELDARALFPFDASFLLENGLDALSRQLGIRGVEEDTSVETLERLRPHVETLHRLHGAPRPYYALLEMDGDGVGEALGKLDSLKDRVKALDAFADAAEKTVRRHHGCAFYTGGDELLAYLPLDTALAAARDLAKLFAARAEHIFPPEVTLSGGLVIAHVKDDLRGSRAAAHEALRQAKMARRRAGRQESWLEIRELPRSGSPRICSGSLTELTTDLARWQLLLERQQLSLRTAQILYELAAHFEDKKDPSGNLGNLGIELVPPRLAAQMKRSSKTDPKSGESPITKALEHLDARIAGLSSWRDARRLASELKTAASIHRVAALRPSSPGESPDEHD